MSISVVAYGGGTNSKGMLCGFIERGVRFDLIQSADTGGELPGWREDIERTSDWLQSHGLPRIIVVHKVLQDGTPYTLEQDCLAKKMLPSIAYGFKTCSKKYKIQPQDKYVNNWKPAIDAWARGEKIIKYIGYDAGEERRAKFTEDDKYKFVYPLIEWGWDREDCVAAIKRHGLTQPGKSACFFCPSSKAWEIRALRDNHPDLLARALAMEANAKENLQSVKGLGRDWAWTDLIDFEDRQGDLFKTRVEVPCGCYDGGEA